jgi:hypothetical protein
MRRSSVVRLTLLPILATAAVAAAQPGPQDPEPVADPVAEPMLAPPSMTPTIQQLDCDQDPNWELRDDCVQTDHGVVIVRGGFGGYFWSGGG